jgi:hypothetical protein
MNILVMKMRMGLLWIFFLLIFNIISHCLTYRLYFVTIVCILFNEMCLDIDTDFLFNATCI